MKTKNLFRAALLSLTTICILIFSVSAIAVKTTGPVKKKTHAKPQQGWYFRFYDSHGNEFIVEGFGGGTSGSITAVYQSCIGGTLGGGGTASGRYSISNFVATLSNVVVDGTYTFSGTATQYSGLGDPMKITDCGSGGQ